MPRHLITTVVFDHRNSEHIRRATLAEVESVLLGAITARRNRAGGTADWIITGTADSGRELTVVYDYDDRDGSAYPITAF